MASKYLRADSTKALIAPGKKAISAPVAGKVLTVLVTFVTLTVDGQTAVAAVAALVAAELAEAAALALELTHFFVSATVVVEAKPATTAADTLLLEPDELELEPPFEVLELEAALEPDEAAAPFPTTTALELEELELELELDDAMTAGLANSTTANAMIEMMTYFIFFISFFLLTSTS